MLKRSLIGMAVALLALASGSLVSTASAQQRVIVLPFEGPRASGVQRMIERSLEHDGYTVVDQAELDRAVARSGRARDSSEVASRVGAQAIVDGDVTRRGRRASVSVRVRDASTGRVLAEERFAGRNERALRSTIDRTGSSRIGSAVGRGHVAQAEAEESPIASRSTTSRGTTARADEEAPPRTEADHEETAAAVRADAATRPHFLVINAGATVFSRELSYNDDLFGQLRPYTLAAAPGLRFGARWYPGAHATSDFGANFGITAEAGGAVGLRSRQSDGTTYPTDSWGFALGADVRLPAGPFEGGLGLSYGMHAFTVGASESGDQAAMPGVEYQYLRPSARGRLDLGAGLYLEAAFGWRILTASGGMGTWFPRNSGSGFDLGAWLGWESDLGIGLRAGFEMQRYFFSMNPEPGDTYVAGGAADQYLAGALDVVWRVR